MIVEFIGQGLYEDETETCGNHICSALEKDFFDNITFFVAFLRETGLTEIISFLKSAQEKGKNITFFVGIDQKVTSKQALKKLLELNIPTYIYYSASYIYHPKVYLFEGPTKNRVIVSSSNFTFNGLFNNTEASVLIDFSNQDKAGLKFLNQLKDYFAPLLEYEDPNLNPLTSEYIDELFQQGLISSEVFEQEVSSETLTKTYDIPKRPKKRRKLGVLGNIEIDENREYKKWYRYSLKITDEYLAKWEEMFGRLKKYKEKYGTTVVSKHHEDRTLFGWYRRQKAIYNFSKDRIPKQHYEQLISLDPDFFVHGQIRIHKNSVDRWIEILKNALADGEDIGLSHRYTYNGEDLGTFLQGVSQANKKGKRLDVKERIETETAFRFASKSRNNTDTLHRFIDDLLNAEQPDKMLWRTRLFKHIPKVELIDEKLKIEIEEAWELQFGEKPVWRKQHDGFSDRTDEWKEHRKVVGVWYPIKITDGRFQNLYTWAKRKLTSKKTMDKIKHKFNEAEIIELRNSGFPV